jgi:hypothetical protein
VIRLPLEPGLSVTIPFIGTKKPSTRDRFSHFNGYTIRDIAVKKLALLSSPSPNCKSTIRTIQQAKEESN